MVKVDEDLCIGCGLCANICKEVFEMNKDGKSQIKKGAKIDNKCVKEAIKSCPVEAIIG